MNIKPMIQRAMGQRPILHDERGLSTVEYVVLLVLICAACVGLWSAFGSRLVDKLQGASDEFNDQVKFDSQGSGQGSSTENRGGN